MHKDMAWITPDDVKACVARTRETVTREDHIAEIEEMIANDRDNVFSYSTAVAFAYDAWERKQRLEELLACATAGKRIRHLQGLFATSTSAHDPTTNQKIAESMKEKFPATYAITRYTPFVSSTYLSE
jgi:hypothetical protein